MTARVLLGSWGGAHGLWVSKPGWNVLDAPESQMLMSINGQAMQVVHSGIVAAPPYNDFTGAINHVDMGFHPFVMLSCPRYMVAFERLSWSSFRIKRLNDRPGGGNLPTTITWAVTTIPVAF
jgi:hypothetical protein